MGLKIFIFHGLMFLMILGCSSDPVSKGRLGMLDSRRLIVLGERVDEVRAFYYKQKYGGIVWFTPSRGGLSNSARKVLTSTIGPSYEMKVFINELKSINYTLGDWEFIVPREGRGFFVKSLKYLEADALGKAKGKVVLLDATFDVVLEDELDRVSAGNFTVVYLPQEPSRKGK